MSIPEWRLYRITTRYEIHGLDAEAATRLVAGFAATERREWYAWREGYPDWIPVSQCSEINPLARPPVAPAPPRLGAPTWSLYRVLERRARPRVSLSLRAVLVLGEQCFRTHTEDVSTGGVKLRHALADATLMKRPCRVVLLPESEGSEEGAQFHARLIVEDGVVHRLCFTGGDQFSLDRLARWLEGSLRLCA